MYALILANGSLECQYLLFYMRYAFNLVFDLYGNDLIEVVNIEYRFRNRRFCFHGDVRSINRENIKLNSG